MSAKRKALSTSSASPAAKRAKLDDGALISMAVKGGSASTAENEKVYPMKNRRSSGKAKEEVLSAESQIPEGTGVSQISSKTAEMAKKSVPEMKLSAEKSTPETTAAKKTTLNGLLNSRNACFMNAIIQMMDTALDSQNVDSILANIEERVYLEDFEGHDLTKADLDASLYDATRRKCSRSRKNTPCTEERNAEAGNQKSRQRERYRASRRG